MGFFDSFDWENPMNVVTGGQQHAAGGGGFSQDSDMGRLLSVAGDPMDLYGNRAANAQEQANETVNAAADRSMNALRGQYDSLVDINQPYSQLGTNALSGFGQYEQGANFAPMLHEGSQAIGRGAAASGMYNSSATGQNLSDFVNNLTQEDMNRQYQQQLDQVRIGQQAVGDIAAGGANFGSAASTVYGNTGNALSQNALNYGAARQDSLNQAGNIAGSAINYYGS